MQRREVIIVGGGLAGFAAATTIARQGVNVRLFEQSNEPGGRARTQKEKGFYFNIGPHALYYSGRGRKVLEEIGVCAQGAAPSVSGAYAVSYGEKHTFPAGPVSLLITSLFGLSAKLEFARLLGSLSKIEGEPLMGVSLRDWVDEHISHTEVKELMLAVFRLATYVNAPHQMSAGAAIEQMKMALDKNVLYIDGGWQTIVDSLVAAAREAGVHIETGTKITRIARDESGHISAVYTADDRLYESSTVLVAASPSVAARLVDRSEDTRLAVWADEAIPVKAACLDVALTRLPCPKATFALGLDAPLYFSVHSAAAQLAPEGGALIHLAKYLPPRNDESAGAVERELEALLDLLQPGWRDLLAYRRFMPDMIVTNALPTARNEGTKGRPKPLVEDVPGLFIAGDWVGEEGLLADASLASAKQAAEAIANELKAAVVCA